VQSKKVFFDFYYFVIHWLSTLPKFKTLAKLPFQTRVSVVLQNIQNIIYLVDLKNVMLNKEKLPFLFRNDSFTKLKNFNFYKLIKL